MKKNTNIKGEISDSQPPKVDGWRKQKTSFGTAISGNEDQTQVKAADFTLVTSGVSKNVTADQLKEFVTKKGLIIKSCELLTNVDKNPNARSEDSEEYEKSKDGIYWPYRIYVRMFKNFRQKKELYSNLPNGRSSLTNYSTGSGLIMDSKLLY